MRPVRHSSFGPSSTIRPLFSRYHALYEDVGRYENGTLFPVHLGDRLDGDRYIIWDKLGFGLKSHIWLAKDQQSSGFVALKLLPGSIAKLQSQTEVSILQLIQKRALQSSSTGSNHIRKYLRQFIERRGHTEYHGIVMEVTGQSVQNKLLSDEIPFAKTKEIIKGTICGLRFLQEECKIAHGDLYFGNICFSAPNFTGMTDDQVRGAIGPVKKSSVYKIDGGERDSFLPEYTVCEASFDSDGPVKIIDFGQAWQFGHRPEHIQIHPTYRPPELIGDSGRLTNDIGLDSWMLGCTLFRIFTGGFLFDGKLDEQLRAQIDEILHNPHMTPKEALYQQISENTPMIPEQDRGHLAQILEGLIAEDPDKRLSALKLAQDPWLQC